MKALTIALKDIKQSFRSLSALIFMFGVPILMTGLFHFLLGGTDTEEAFVPVIPVQVVNLDTGEAALGDTLVDILQGDAMKDILDITVSNEKDLALNVVEDGLADSAVIIPAGFSDSLINADMHETLEIHFDPEKEIGPGIVESIVTQSVESLRGPYILQQISLASLQSVDLQIDEEYDIQFGTFIENESKLADQKILNIQPIGKNTGNWMDGFVQMLMAAMMIFYAFYTGATNMQTILTEEEQGTLQRLFTSATPRNVILTGKFLSTFLTVCIQMTVLLLAGRIIFQYQWGSFLPLVLVVLSTTAAAAGFGIFLISMTNNSKQAGAVIGAGVTLTGLLGMVKIFTMSTPNPPQSLDMASRFVPQGWALNALHQLINNGAMSGILTASVVLLTWAIVFFLIGNFRFSKRFS